MEGVSMMKKFYLVVFVIVIGFVLLFAGTTWAIPILQTYIEGATYDTTTETWVLYNPGDPIRLWAIGNVSGPGSKGAIYDVRLSAAYAAPDVGSVNISLNPSTTGGYGGIADPSTPNGTGNLLQTVMNGSSPTLSDGSDLPTHGIFGPGIYWQEFDLDDFTLSDSHMGDFIDDFPSVLFPDTGQINVYEVSLSGTSKVHFDLYGTIITKAKKGSEVAVFAPFSHDCGTGVPEPATVFLLLGIAIFAFLPLRKKRNF